MVRTVVVALGLVLALTAAAILAVLVPVAAILSSKAVACGTIGAAGIGNTTPIAANQTAYVQAVIGIGKTLGIPEQGWIVAIATGLQESGLKNYANENVTASMAIPHDAVGAKDDSLGIFQQRPSVGWGGPAQIMSIALAAEAFYGAKPVGMTSDTGLMDVPGWQSMSLTDAAQAVQHSAYPEGYQHWAGEATQLAATNAAAPALPLPLPPGNHPSTSQPGSPVPSGGSCPAGATGAPQQVSATPGLYYNPLRSVAGLTPGRIDQGVDYSGSGPLYALGDGVVLTTTVPGWPGGAMITIRVTDGPATGAVVYEAENITPAVAVGQVVNANTVLGTLHNGYPNLEIGWGSSNPPGNPLAQSYGGFHDGASTALGINFSQLLVKLGAPPGISYPVIGTLPSGWPTW